jgi:hypothetical protein
MLVLRLLMLTRRLQLTSLSNAKMMPVLQNSEIHLLCTR